uniref:Uncharacterized protein n=1 Tax=Caenorhabditis japonica TaxID=281687 RepID=A0A8R1I789_CAEJA
MPAKPSPRKAVFATSSVASTSSTPTSTGSPMVKTMTLQKENMEKLLPVVPLRRRTSYGSPRRPQFHQQINQQTPPTTAPKRRLEEAPSIPTPPPKKPSLDSWDEHVHNSMEEEHVDEEEGRDVRRPIPEESDDIGGEESSDGRKDSVGSGGEVWVPQDRGGEVAPEQYAREILEHCEFFHLYSKF